MAESDLHERVEVHRAVWTPSRLTEESYRNVMRTWPYRAELDCVLDRKRPWMIQIEIGRIVRKSRGIGKAGERIVGGETRDGDRLVDRDAAHFGRPGRHDPLPPDSALHDPRDLLELARQQR